MWTSIIKAGVYLVVLTFLMFVLRSILSPIIDVAMAGDHSSAPVVQRVSGYFGALTLENLTLIAALSVGIYLLGRAAVERNVG